MKCTNIEFIEHLNDEDDIMLVTIDDTVTAYLIGSYANYLDFVGKDVIVTYRKDLYKGNITQFINTVTIPAKVVTLDRDEKTKLFTSQTDNQSNVCIADIDIGDTRLNAELYCISHTYQSSAKSAWAELTVRDRALKVSTLRLFDYDFNEYDYSGRYIRADIRKTAYGLTTTMVTPLEESCKVNPEVSIAKTFIYKSIQHDEELLKILSDTKMLEYMSANIDVEQGYGLVRLAYELSICNELYNMTDSVKAKTIARALVLSYSYYLNLTSDFSPQFINMINISKYSLDDKHEIMMLLDSGNSPERLIYDNIKQMADNLIKIRKGLIEW